MIAGALLIVGLYLVYRFPKLTPLLIALGALVSLNTIEGFDKAQEFYEYQYNIDPDSDITDLNGRRFGMECRGTCQEYDHACRDFCTDQCKHRCNQGIRG